MKQLFLLFIMIFLTHCTTVNPDAARANAALGLAYLKHDDKATALEILQHALDEDPSNLDALESIAYYYQVTDNKNLAEYYYRKALKIHPNNPQAQNNLGVFLCQNNQTTQGKTLLEKASVRPEYLYASDAKDNTDRCL